MEGDCPVRVLKFISVKIKTISYKTGMLLAQRLRKKEKGKKTNKKQQQQQIKNHGRKKKNGRNFAKQFPISSCV